MQPPPHHQPTSNGAPCCEELVPRLHVSARDAHCQHKHLGRQGRRWMARAQGASPPSPFHVCLDPPTLRCWGRYRLDALLPADQRPRAKDARMPAASAAVVCLRSPNGRVLLQHRTPCSVDPQDRLPARHHCGPSPLRRLLPTHRILVPAPRLHMTIWTPVDLPGGSKMGAADSCFARFVYMS